MAWSILKLFNKKRGSDNGSMTAAQFLAQQAENQDYQQKMAKKERARLSKMKRLGQEETELVKDLNVVGIQVDSVWDLVNSTNTYEAAIPVLLKHLDKKYSAEIREGLVRALTIPEARGVVDTKLLEMFKSEEDKSFRWIIGNALATVASKKNEGQILGLLSESSYGEERNMLVYALARLQKTRAIPLLISYVEDKNLVAQSAIALGNLDATQAKEALYNVNHSDPWVMKQVKDALRKIG